MLKAIKTQTQESRKLSYGIRRVNDGKFVTSVPPYNSYAVYFQGKNSQGVVFTDKETYTFTEHTVKLAYKNLILIDYACGIKGDYEILEQMTKVQTIFNFFTPKKVDKIAVQPTSAWEVIRNKIRMEHSYTMEENLSVIFKKAKSFEGLYGFYRIENGVTLIKDHIPDLLYYRNIIFGRTKEEMMLIKLVLGDKIKKEFKVSEFMDGILLDAHKYIDA